MLPLSSPFLMFSVRRREPELIVPSKPTPHELKYLSDIDDQQTFRFQIPVIMFYRDNILMRGRDPVRVIREALSQALVYYYPFAGRLREGHGGKLIVDCTGEGVLFIEAEADIRIEHFGDELYPPFPCMEELLYDVSGSGGILNCPLLLIQVTRLMCGGFILAIRLNHTMSDMGGLVQFLTAVSEIAQGLQEPSLKPVWKRELLNARNPPNVSFVHREYYQVLDTIKRTPIPFEDWSQKSFVFDSKVMFSLRQHLPPNHPKCTTFELITACLWRCRTIALQLDPDEEVLLISSYNARHKYRTPLPNGYYGNVLAYPSAQSKARDLCKKPLMYALELVRKAKDCVSDEYMRSMTDLLVTKGRPHVRTVRTLVVTDLRRLGLGDVDFGWGKAVYGGTTKAGEGNIPGIAYHLVSFKNKKGENGITVLVCLPELVMKRFTIELENMIRNPTFLISTL